MAAAFTPPRPRPPRAIRPNGLRRPDACHPPGVRTTGWLRYEAHGSRASAKPTRDKGIGMRKTHRHHHTDGMARAVGTAHRHHHTDGMARAVGTAHRHHHTDGMARA